MKNKTTVWKVLIVLQKLYPIRFWFEDGVVWVYPKEKQVEKTVIRVYNVGNLQIPPQQIPGPNMILNSPGDNMQIEPQEEDEIIDIPVDELPDLFTDAWSCLSEIEIGDSHTGPRW